MVAPVDAFARLIRQSGPFWLDSSLPRPTDGRYSVMGCDPKWVFTSRDDSWELRAHGTTLESGPTAALSRLDQLLEQHRVLGPDENPSLPFVGGAVGWLAYDLGRQFEAVEGSAQRDDPVPDIRLAWYDAALVWDHATAACWLVWTGEHAIEAADALERYLLESPVDLTAKVHDSSAPAGSDMTRREYLERVELARAGIARGEFYQLNLVQRFECARREPPEVTYLRLRELNPSPFSAFISTGDCAVLSSSPERFIELSPEGVLRTCPIKGTRPRGRTAAEDAAQQAELRTSEKERAELLMIVDLLRNDLGRVCVTGSVQVTRLHDLETFATVHHLVGEVQGQLNPGTTRRELLRAMFPGGSITGAPKVTAMRAIDRLEPHRRGIAMGAIGYFSAHGRIDLNIAIRTIICRGDIARIAVGAGIVWDSDSAAEYEETLAKARALFAALGVRPSTR